MGKQGVNQMQLATTAVKPVRPYNRFGASKIAGTGKDPQGAYAHFVKNDPYKNIDVYRDRFEANKDSLTVKIPAGQVPYGTTTCTYRYGLNTEAKLKRSELGISTKTFPRNATDNVSFEPPEQSRPFQSMFDLIVTKNRYEKNTQSSTSWQPRPVTVYNANNRSGGAHDIITHLPHQYQGCKTLGILDKKAVNRQKGITEFADRQSLASVNPNPDLRRCLNDNPYEFRRSNGVFTNMYDSAKRFGESKVFQAGGMS